jgi:hypothetical protein
LRCPCIETGKSLIVPNVEYLSLGHNLLTDVPVLRQEKSLIVPTVKHLLVGHYLLVYLLVSTPSFPGHWDALNSYTNYHKFQEKNNFTSEITSKFLFFQKTILPGDYKYFFLQIFTGVPPAVASLNYCTHREIVQFSPIPILGFSRGFLFIY